MVLPLEPTDVPGVYRRGSKFVVVYRVEGRQRKESADTLGEARVIKLMRDGEARAHRRGPTLHEFSLSWLDRYAGSGHDSVRSNTRREYRQLLINFALTYFDRKVRVRDLDRAAVQHFVDWLTTRPGRGGRLCDRSIANVLTPLRLALDAAVAEGLLATNPAEQVVLPRRRAGRAWSTRERRFLTRAELVRCSMRSRPSGGRCLSCSPRPGCVSLRRSVCAGAISSSTPTRRISGCAARSSRARSSPRSPATRAANPMTAELAATLRAQRARDAEDDAFVFPGRNGGASDHGSLRRRTLVPAAERAGLTGVGFHTLDTRAPRC
jgi:integrase